MKLTYELTDKQKLALEELGIIPINKREPRKKWLPTEEGFILDGVGGIDKENFPIYTEIGATRKTREQIECLRKLRLNHDTLHALVCELEPDNIGHVKDKAQYYIINYKGKWESDPSITYYPDSIPINKKETAEKIIAMLNNGEFTFEE